MRTFIALELPQEFCDEVASLAHALKRTIEGRFMKRETYHLTLAFLGDINESTAVKVIESIDAVLPLLQPIRLNGIESALASLESLTMQHSTYKFNQPMNL